MGCVGSAASQASPPRLNILNLRLLYLMLRSYRFASHSTAEWFEQEFNTGNGCPRYHTGSFKACWTQENVEVDEPNESELLVEMCPCGLATLISLSLNQLQACQGAHVLGQVWH